MNRIPKVAAAIHVINRHERSPLEFHGTLLFESEGREDSDPLNVEPRYRIRAYQETGRGFVLEVAIVASDKVMLQLADFAESASEVDDLLCLIHGDAMDGYTDVVSLDAGQTRLLDKRLEAELDRLSVHVMKQLQTMVADEA